MSACSILLSRDIDLLVSVLLTVVYLKALESLESAFMSRQESD